MVIKLKELEDLTGGIYCLSPTISKGRFSMKVGRTVNFKDRLNAYHLCFNEGFHLLGILPLKARVPEADRMKFVRIMEKKVFELLKDDQMTYPNRRRGSEWYTATMTKIKKAFKEVHKSSRQNRHQYTMPPMFDFKNSFVNVYNVEGVKNIPMKVDLDKSNEDKIVIKKNTKQSMRKITGYKK